MMYDLSAFNKYKTLPRQLCLPAGAHMCTPFSHWCAWALSDVDDFPAKFLRLNNSQLLGVKDTLPPTSSLKWSPLRSPPCLWTVCKLQSLLPIRLDRTSTCLLSTHLHQDGSPSLNAGTPNQPLWASHGSSFTNTRRSINYTTTFGGSKWPHKISGILIQQNNVAAKVD